MAQNHAPKAWHENAAIRSLVDAIARRDPRGVREAAAKNPEQVSEAFARADFWRRGEAWGDRASLLYFGDGAGVDQRGGRHSEKSQKEWIATAEALEAAGWASTDDETLRDVLRDNLLRWGSSLGAVEWAAARGLLGVGGSFWERNKMKPEAAGLLLTLSESEAGAERIWTALRAQGVVGGPIGLSAADFACAGAWRLAERLLAEEGWCECGPASGDEANRLGPLEGRLAKMSPRDCALLDLKTGRTQWGDDAEEARKAREAVEALRRMRKMGAQWDAKGSSEAFATLLGGGWLSYGRCASPKAVEIVGAELIAMGADPNDGPGLAMRLAEMELAAQGGEWRPKADFFVAWSVRIGLDFSRHAGAAQARIAGHGESRGAWEVADRLASWGAAWDKIDPTDPSPVASALRQKEHVTALRLVKLGAPFAYVDQGECALHAIAGSATASGLATLRAALANPGVAAQVNLPSVAEGREGETALHQACAVLNLKAMAQLLAAGANPNAQDAKGWTPIRHALRKRGAKAQKIAHQAIAALVAAGADPSLRDKSGLTAAQSAAGSAPLGALAELLGERPEDLAEGNAGAKARKKLALRGEQGLAMAEQSELRALVARASKKSARSAPAEGELEAGAADAAQAPALAKRRPRSL
jgi:hypothetical protein